MDKKQLQFFKSLQIKKYRTLHQSFPVEGAKSVLELLTSDFIVETVLATPAFLEQHVALLQNFDCQPVTEAELSQAGAFETNNAALALARMKDNDFQQAEESEMVLVLDNLRDPGNLGTILRIADWYGVSKVICSEESVDFYNPKVIAASMGSFTRVKTYYASLPAYFRQIKPQPVFGAMLNGENVHQTRFSETGYLVLGNESRGISTEVQPFLTQKITIPRFGGAESLNAAIAAAILCDNWRRG
jgi:RNA methyltransferase, TrmH family